MPVDREELLRIRDAMKMRGPDGAGLWISRDGRTGLCHRRLAIIDLSDAGMQPMSSVDGMTRIVFNGEIYNYRSLRKRLEKKGIAFRSNSDTEVLLHLYAEKGADMMSELRGMYTFALWDEARKGMLLARDPFGIKPLYYANDGRTLRFASQVKALVCGGAVDTGTEPAGHVGFFLWGSVPEPFTLYKGIRALSAGSWLWLDAYGGRMDGIFCDISEELAIAGRTARVISHEEAIEQLHLSLLDSVTHHLIADVPVGLFLSAGLDSSLIMALAFEAGYKDIRAVTLGFEEYRDTENDEPPLAAKVAAYYGADHLIKWVTKNDFKVNMEWLFKVMDQPSIDGVNTFFVAKAVAESGLKVAMSGLGGDELFGGYPSFRDVPKMAKLGISPNVMKPLGKVFRTVAAPMVKHFTSPKYAGLLEYGGTWSGAYLLRRGMFMPWELPEIIDGDLVRQGWETLQPLARLEESVAVAGCDQLKVSSLEMSWYMRNQLLRDADWAGMAHSVEIRVPLVDLGLLRGAAPLVAASGQLTKQDAVYSLANALPRETMSRPKTGFSVPVREWLLGGDTDYTGQRGLRGWARKVYDIALQST